MSKIGLIIAGIYMSFIALRSENKYQKILGALAGLLITVGLVIKYYILKI